MVSLMHSGYLLIKLMESILMIVMQYFSTYLKNENLLPKEMEMRFTATTYRDQVLEEKTYLHMLNHLMKVIPAKNN